MPINVRSSTCRTRKSATSARLIAPKSPVPWRVQDAVATSCGAVFQKSWPDNRPVEPWGPNNPLLHVLVVIDTLQEQGNPPS